MAHAVARSIISSEGALKLAGLVRRGCAALSVLSVLVIPAQAATYYVSPSGADSNSCATAKSTTSSNNKRTIAAGVSCLAPGDTLYIRGGVYTGPGNVIDSQRFTVPSGTSWSNAITIAGHPGEIVTLRVPWGLGGITLTDGAPHYLIFQDFVIDMSEQTSAESNGIYLSSGAHHNRFLRLDVKNNSGNGIAFSANNANSPFNEVLDCLIHDNGRASGVNQGYGAYVSTSDNLFAGNSIYNNGGYGLHFYDNSGPKDVARNVIRNNKIYGNGTHGGTNYGIVVAWGADNEIYNNLIYRNRGGIQIHLESATTKVYNNTIYANAPSPGIALQYYAAGPAIVRNNIVYGNGAGVVDYGGSGTPALDHNLTTDAKFVNAAANDFRLQQGSAAEDTGMTVSRVAADFAGITRPQGGAYDIGAYERQQSGGAPSPPRKLKVIKIGK